MLGIFLLRHPEAGLAPSVLRLVTLVATLGRLNACLSKDAIGVPFTSQSRISEWEERSASW